MHRPLTPCAPYALIIALLVAACGGSDSTTPTTPTAPDPIIEPAFTGTLNINGGRTHTFAAERAGTVTATLTSLSANDAGVVPTVGLSLGSFNTLTNACQAILSNDSATQSTALTGAASTAGTLCVRVYDQGQLTQPTDYSIVVTHF